MSESDSPDSTGSKRSALIIGIVVIVAALVGALVLVTSNDDDATTATSERPTTVPEAAAPTTEAAAPDTEPSATEPPTTEPPTTEPPSTPSPTTEPPPVDATRESIWPWADSTTGFTEPVVAATSFAVDYLGFADPVVGDFQAGDARSGEVEARELGPKTVDFVRQLTDDDSWWVLGAAAENITIDEPAQGTTVVSPLTISGSASAFEGTVDVELRADGDGEPIHEGFVTGSGSPEPGPYSDTFEFTSPGTAGGALVLISRNSETGSPVIEASALRIFFE